MSPVDAIRITCIGGPTVLLELDGLLLLTDPTFDPAGTSYPTPHYTLHKLTSPALGPDQLGKIDAVLLSHDHHFDNRDIAGRAVLRRARQIFTTRAGAERLGDGTIGLAPGEEQTLVAPNGRELLITATPARHGPADGDRGPVIGFTLRWTDAPEAVLYVSGDTVWYDGVARADELVQVARARPGALIVPLHLEGWAHFSESRSEVVAAFAAAV